MPLNKEAEIDPYMLPGQVLSHRVREKREVKTIQAYFTISEGLE